jgi:hypothetical protein
MSKGEENYLGLEGKGASKIISARERINREIKKVYYPA